VLVFDRLGEYKIFIFLRAVAVNTLVYKRYRFAIRHHFGCFKSRKSPSFSGRVFVMIFNHVFHLFKRAGSYVAVFILYLVPGDFGKGGAIRPGVDIVLFNSLRGFNVFDSLTLLGL